MFKKIAFITFTALASSASYAAKCDSQGNLVFLGKIKDESRSVWLSGTSGG